MPLLAIDTTMGAVSVALRWRTATGTEEIRAACEVRATGHAERLFPMIEALLAACGQAPARLRRVAVTVGPGTFTGVRTGVAAARGLALAAGCEIVGLSSLAVLALGVMRIRGAGQDGGLGRRGLAVVVDARRSEVYLQLFPDGDVTTAEAPVLAGLADMPRLLAGGDWLLAGSGAALVAERLVAEDKSLAARCEVLAVPIDPDAADLARIAHRLTPLVVVEPLYIRAPDALPQLGRSLPRVGS